MMKKINFLNNKKEIVINAKHHYYINNERYFGGNSLALLLNSIFKMQDDSEIRATVNYKIKITEYTEYRKWIGNQVHEVFEEFIIAKKENKNFNFLEWIKHHDFEDEEIENAVKNFGNYLKKEQISCKHWLTELSLAGKIKLFFIDEDDDDKKKNYEINAAGTFDAFDEKNGILYEFKTANKEYNFKKWKYQTIFYSLLLEKRYNINKIVIIYARRNEFETYEFDWNEMKKEFFEMIEYWNLNWYINNFLY